MSQINPQSDEEIITLYKNGSQEIFKDLVNRYTSSIYNYSARVANRNDASDITQEVFIKVWKNLNRFDESKASFKTWIFTIARNTVTDFLRKKRNLLFSDLEKEGIDEENSFIENIPDDQILADEVIQKLEDKIEDNTFLNNILSKLNPTYKEILLLHYQEEMTFAEISKILKKPLNTVKSGHRRALLELKKKVI